MRYFVFLEFTDPKLREFLNNLRSALMGRPVLKPAHVTIRGPYDTYPEPDTLSALRENLQGYGVFIGGAGTFKTGSGYVVYLRVSSPVFSEIWWKPDFSIEKYGINPHITVFETESKNTATAVERFLRAERIDISTFNIALTIYASKQMELFGSDHDMDPVLEKRRATFGKWRVNRDILQRATALHSKFSELGSRSRSHQLKHRDTRYK